MIYEVVKNTEVYFVENVRTARRFISSLQLGITIDHLEFFVLDKRSTSQSVQSSLAQIRKRNVGLMSEAGLPGLADPGNLLISLGHQQGHRIIPLPGASSIQTALICSGFNGQEFTFHGYLPIDPQDRNEAMKTMVKNLENTGYTQIFMETPFRNNTLLKDLVRKIPNHFFLSIATDLFGEQQFIKTRAIGEWRSDLPDIHKIPTMFCLGNFPE